MARAPRSVGRYVRTRDALGRTYYRDRERGGFVTRATWERERARERTQSAMPREQSTKPFPMGAQPPGVPIGHRTGGSGKGKGSGSGSGSGGREPHADPRARQGEGDYDDGTDDQDWAEVDGEEDYE